MENNSRIDNSHFESASEQVLERLKLPTHFTSSYDKLVVLQIHYQNTTKGTSEGVAEE